MIFVTIGASEFQFNRMLRWVDGALAGLGIPRETVFFQIGLSSYRPRNGEYTGFVDFREMEERIKNADLVICHAGAGTVLISLVNGKKPIVIPRRKEYAEAVDNHQVAFADHLASNNLVIYPRTTRDLKEAIAAPEAHLSKGSGLASVDQSRDRLIRYLSEELEDRRGR